MPAEVDLLEIIEWPQPGAAARAYGGWWIAERRFRPRDGYSYTPIFGPFKDSPIRLSLKNGAQDAYDFAMWAL